VAASTSSDDAPRIGRPPRIDREAIAQAVIDLGFEDVTVKRVAAHLDVSVPGLYHYVNGKDDLIRLAAEHRLATHTLPTSNGQDWATWLREWGWHIYRSMSDRPELIELYLSDGLDPDRTTSTVAIALEHLVDAGFDVDVAYDMWETVSTTALGAAMHTVHWNAVAANGEPWRVRLQHALLGRDSVPADVLVSLGTAIPRDPNDAFEHRLGRVIDELRHLIDGSG
jgi:AcrR family transcriptional regulator